MSPGMTRKEDENHWKALKATQDAELSLILASFSRVKPEDPTLSDLERALNFYECGPDGQYDDIAAYCIKYVMDEMKGSRDTKRIKCVNCGGLNMPDEQICFWCKEDTK